MRTATRTRRGAIIWNFFKKTLSNTLIPKISFIFNENRANPPNINILCDNLIRLHIKAFHMERPIVFRNKTSRMEWHNDSNHKVDASWVGLENSIFCRKNSSMSFIPIVTVAFRTFSTGVNTNWFHCSHSSVDTIYPSRVPWRRDSRGMVSKWLYPMPSRSPRILPSVYLTIYEMRFITLFRNTFCTFYSKSWGSRQ